MFSKEELKTAQRLRAEQTFEDFEEIIEIEEDLEELEEIEENLEELEEIEEDLEELEEIEETEEIIDWIGWFDYVESSIPTIKDCGRVITINENVYDKRQGIEAIEYVLSYAYFVEDPKTYYITQDSSYQKGEEWYNLGLNYIHQDFRPKDIPKGHLKRLLPFMDHVIIPLNMVEVINQVLMIDENIQYPELLDIIAIHKETNLRGHELLNYCNNYWNEDDYYNDDEDDYYDDEEDDYSRWDWDFSPYDKVPYDINYEENKTGIKIISPINYGDIREEGLAMNHCVGRCSTNYIGAVHNKETIILFVRDKTNHRLATLEINEEYKVLQLRGESNKKVDRVTYEVVKKFIHQHDGFIKDEWC